MRDDALPIARIVFIGCCIAMGVAAAVVVVLAILSARHVPVGGQAIDKPPPSGSDVPMLQSAPQADLAAWRQEKSRALNELGWVDAASGVAHVPIDVAMGMLVERAGRAASQPVAVTHVDPQTPSSAGAAGERR